MQKDRLKPGLTVQFRLGDIHLPAIAEILNRMTEDTELQGSITLLSDAGDQRAAFAVVDVKGVLMPIIVPVAALKPAPATDDAARPAQTPARRTGTEG